jgi:cytochrome c biogenesis protein CcmG, thiol:disulfide interchange protein DsbE
MHESPTPSEPGTPPTSAPPYERSRAVTWIGLAVIGLLLVVYLIIRPRPASEEGTNHPAAGQPIIFFELAALTDANAPLSKSDLRGKVTLVNLWGTWCGPCAEEFPYLIAIHRKHKNHRDFQYVSVSYPGDPTSLDAAGVPELREATDEFLARQRADHATYCDLRGQSFRALLLIGVEDAMPTTLVIDRQGVVRGVWQGYNRASMSEIERLLEVLLGE